jgi:UDP-glucose 4-epimerase
MKVVVTGGAGFIGSHLVRALAERGDQVVVIDNLSTGKESNLAPVADRCRLVLGDIRERDLLLREFRDVEVVFHQAAMVSVQKSVENPLECNEVNVRGTLNVIECARHWGVRRVVFASTCAIYGDSEVLPKREELPPCPLSPYAVSKLVGEQYGLLYRRLYGLPVQPLRYFNVFGPGQDPTSDYAAVIPRFISRMLAGERPIIFGDGEQTRDFVYVGNVVQANLLAAERDSPGHPVNIGSGTSYSLNQLVSILNGILGTSLEPEYREPRPGDVRHSRADVSLARRVLGFAPAVGLREGLEETVGALERGSHGSRG